MTHDLKTWPEFFEPVSRNLKPFEVRRDDRRFEVGDELNLLEYDPCTSSFTGRSTKRIVSYKLSGPGFGIEAGFCVLGFPVSASQA